ncbi:hypothetical protein GRF29_19g1883647 [Pseudopithomyces chartarum]|uniref:Uncharacterized protein n=1 Tax=Pseudopithomyces chartarum TaxID=1892770 RepID=A0AAN6M4Z6_9PLEO|nr:hypothetical protein GRF29_19g1883647 [Pseudopithomyces chartarum]
MRRTLPCQLRLRKTIWPIPPSQSTPRSTSSSAPEQTPLRAAYYRGGTARAVVLQPQDLPANHAKWRAVFRQLLACVGQGEPFGRQLHRLTKGTSSLGRICLVEPHHTSDPGDPSVPHIDYTLVSLDTKSGHVDVSSNSGNLISAVGPYAYNARLLPPDIYRIKDGYVTVRIRNTNTLKLVESTFAVCGGQAAVTGKYGVDGVNGKASEITLAFQDPTRSVTKKAFPTGRAVDVIEGLKVTCVDGAVPVVFVRADAAGIPGTILPHELTGQKMKLSLLEKVRRSAAVAMGISDDESSVPRTIPNIAIVSQSTQHTTVSGATLKASQMDVVLRFISDSEPHPTIPLTGALTTALAARMPGTIVEQLLTPEEAVTGHLTIAHPSGKIHVKLERDISKTTPSMWVGHVSTTAQRLFAGKIYWTDSSRDAETNMITNANNTQHSLGLDFVNELRLRESPQSLVERFYQENISVAGSTSRLERKPDRQMQPSLAQQGLQFPVPSTTRDETHLLRELSTLRTSLSHFTSVYPSPRSPRAKAEPPSPSNISHHLSAIVQHINILTASLAPVPRPLRTVRPDQQKGDEWHRWAKMFSRWDRIRTLREAEKKNIRRESNKSLQARWRDAQLNRLGKRGTPVAMGRWRNKLLSG